MSAVFAPAVGRAARAVRLVAIVEPDHFYEGMYRGLLDGGKLGAAARAQIEKAHTAARASRYELLRQTVALPAL